MSTQSRARHSTQYYFNFALMSPTAPAGRVQIITDYPLYPHFFEVGGIRAATSLIGDVLGLGGEDEHSP
jgi:hypothetical protein